MKKDTDMLRVLVTPPHPLKKAKMIDQSTYSSTSACQHHDDCFLVTTPQSSKKILMIAISSTSPPLLPHLINGSPISILSEADTKVLMMPSLPPMEYAQISISDDDAKILMMPTILLMEGERRKRKKSAPRPTYLKLRKTFATGEQDPFFTEYSFSRTVAKDSPAASMDPSRKNKEAQNDSSCRLLRGNDSPVFSPLAQIFRPINLDGIEDLTISYL
jgi:hypothetical protein